MPLTLYTHPFASYCQKAVIALYENAIPFTPRVLDQADPATFAEFAALWPLKKFPLLVDNGKPIAEASIIIEYLEAHYPGPKRLLPADRAAALDVRFMDRFFDNYVHTPMQTIVFNALRKPEEKDAKGAADARAMLDASYAWLDKRMLGREWASGDFSLADCAAAPALFYADWVHEIGDRFPRVRDYRARLNGRPSFARAIEEARPFRAYFPLGAPDRD